jgi:hypothetical protein
MEVEQAVLTRPVVRPLTPTERNGLTTLLIVAASAAVFGAILFLEKSMGRAREERLVHDGVETSMRLFGISHFLVAILFMATARRMRSPDAWAWLVGLLGLGVALCLGFEGLRGLDARLAGALFLGYFLVHEVRDETFFYVANGDARGEAPGPVPRRDIWLVPLLFLGGLTAAGAAGVAFRIGGARRYAHLLGDLEGPARYAVGLLPFVLVVAAALALKARLDRRHPGGAPGFLRDHRPIFVVFLGLVFVLLVDAAFFGRGLIVTFHVVAWYVFTMHQLRRRAPRGAAAPRALSWSWMRGTAAGFRFLHLAVALLVIALAAVWAYGFRNDPDQAFLSGLLSRDAFRYWTIMHVTVSFLPK